MKILKFQHQGQRQRQEDSWYISNDENLFLVCDGVGSSTHGAEASRIIKESIERHYKNLSLGDYDRDLKKLVVQANYSLLNAFEDLGSSNASSTLVILLLKEGKAYMTHVGDSKIIYIDKTHHEWWVSKDHSLVQELFEAGILGSEREMKTHPLRNRITLSMNSDSLIAESEIKIDTLSKIHAGDIFILCTDGVIENMTTDEIVKLCMEHPAETAFHQIREYCQQNSKDNNTAIFIEI